MEISLAEISNRANAKTAEAKAKRDEYDQEKAQLEDAAKAAVKASATLKDTAQARSSLLKEKEDTHDRVEKTETRLVQASRLRLHSMRMRSCSAQS